MNSSRRTMIKLASAGMALALLKPGLTEAASPEALGNLDFDAAMRALGGAKAVLSQGIRIVAPDLSEHGAMVPVEITSSIPDIESIAIIVERNAIPVVAKFDFQAGMEGYVATRIKMAESSQVHAVVRAGGQTYRASRPVAVTIGGCESYPSPMQSVGKRQEADHD